MEYNGKYGGRVLRKFKADKIFVAGAVLTAEDVKEWPESNRRALHKAGNVEWFGPAGDPSIPSSAPSVKEGKKDKKQTAKDAAEGKEKPPKRTRTK